MNQGAHLSTLIVAETRRRLIGESLPRVTKCLNLLTLEQIWYKHNSNTNSIGNLVLHLCGNIRQWIVAGLGKNADIRERALEFSATELLSCAELVNQFEQVMKEVDLVLAKLTETDLSNIHDVQVYQESGISILMHVVEHCSYHVGQITYLTKYLLDVDTEYYGEDLG